MSDLILPDALVDHSGDGGSIALVVLDGLGGLPHPDSGRTELEAARTPTLDAMAARSSLGMLIPVAPGVTPGSGPGHLGLFGYDPTRFVIGRGVLAALGVGFDLQPGDLAARLNMASLDAGGLITDRRAGRPSDDEGRRVVARVKDALEPIEGVEVFLEPVKEHRAVVVFRGAGLAEGVLDTDPQETGVAPLKARAAVPEAERSAQVLQAFLDQARGILSDEPTINGFMARGVATFDAPPSMKERYGLRAAVIARYPMYRGVARLVGMEVLGTPASDADAVQLFRGAPDFDFRFFHYKATDARGEDGDFDAKVQAVEDADRLVAELVESDIDVVMVTGDHSTPAACAAHSWHHVPLLLQSRWARPTATSFGEDTCRLGDLGTFESRHLMSLALAHAGRLAKFGA
jgi:2,3-bisphosphoglycerate-independent phosphoglycerate mutase